ncbi:MAG: WYL domain-containing protein [Burkholderiaceae bacterium]
MNQTERLYRIDQLISQRQVVSFADLMSALEVSRATLKRDLSYLRDRLNAPIVYDRHAGGYRFERAGVGPQYELPGLWFSDREILALLTMHKLLQDLDTGGLLGEQIEPLITRLNALLERAPGGPGEIHERVRLMPALNRPVPPRFFQRVGAALLRRQRLDIVYWTRTRDEQSRREISPQRLVHYRSAWYLDAWCHRSNGLRMFALDAIREARVLDSPAHELPLAEVARAMGGGYGIFHGEQVQWATLVFEPDAARWVSTEVWHADQRGRWRDDGRYELEIPFAASPELEMDILRHGEQVTVLAPPALRERIGARLQAASARYGLPA